MSIAKQSSDKLAALKRAAESARRAAASTGTALIVLEDGRVRRISGVAKGKAKP